MHRKKRGLQILFGTTISGFHLGQEGFTITDPDATAAKKLLNDETLHEVDDKN